MLRDRREQNAMTGTQPGHTQAKGAKKQGTGAAWQMDMCSGSVLGKMLLFALPLMCSGILQLLFNAADIIVVGRFAGDNSLAAVGSNTALINLMTNFFMGLSIGANVLAAHFYGARQERDLGDTVHTAMLLSIGSGILLTLMGCIGAREILILMKTPSDLLELAVIYLRIYFLGMTATMIYNFGSAILRAVGDTRRPLFYLLAAGVVNVVLNLIFVIGLRMDVAGVGIATVISQCISAGLIFRCLTKAEGGIRLIPRRMRIHKDKLIRILKIGMPASFQGILFSFSNVIIQSSVNSFGPVVVAGNSAAANIEGFVYVAMNAFYQAAISFTGQNLGAAKYERINRILYTALLCVIVVGLTLGNGVVFLGRGLLSLYTGSEMVVEAGLKRMAVVCRTYVLCGMMEVVVGSLRGLGHSVLPMIVSLIGACGLRLLWIFTFFRLEAFHTTTSLYLTYPVSWILTVTAHLICFAVIRRKMEKVWGSRTE